MKKVLLGLAVVATSIFLVSCANENDAQNTMADASDVFQPAPVTEEFINSLREEIRYELREELENEIRAEFSTVVRAEVREEVRAEVTEELMVRLQPSVEATLRNQLRADLAAEVRADLMDEVRREVIASVMANNQDADLPSEPIWVHNNMAVYVDTDISPVRTFIFNRPRTNNPHEGDWESRFNGHRVFVLPITVKNTGDATANFSGFGSVRVFGPNGLEMTRIWDFDGSDIIYASGMLPGAIRTTEMAFLFDGDGEYFIEFHDWNTNRTAHTTITVEGY
ncbi:MAG: hypothetical protein FWD82_06895 [Defluviitaleaceae bacterium]|nr:hypothetical protein [Defluviitaleaceae bacterium]